MFKLPRLILCCIALLPINFFFSSKAMAQSVGVKECDLTGETISSKILQASLSLSEKGYLITLKGKNETQSFGLTKNLNYYYDSSNFFFLEEITPAKISSDGSFLLIVPVTPKRGCTFRGKLVFDPGVKDKLFPPNDIDFCKDAITRAEIMLENAKASATVEKAKHYHKNPPNHRHFSYSLALMGPGTENVLNSPVFLKNITTNIISNCKDIGMVRFGIYATDHARSFGLMNDGNVRGFQCKESSGSNSQEFPWGTEHCL